MTLSKGSTGPDVKQLQRRLNAFGYKLEEDGDFGPATERAVKRFQQACAIEADGICGPKTFAALEAAEAKLNAAATDRERVLSYAFSHLGTTEPEGDDVFIKAYNTASGAGFNLNVPWCQIFVWFCLSYFNLPVPLTASCTQARRWWREQGRWRDVGDYDPQPGDIVYYDWGSDGDCDHVGILAEINDTDYTVIEGNTTAFDGQDGVALKRRFRYAGSIVGFAIPYDPEPEKWFTVRLPLKGAEALAKAYGGEVVEL